MHTPRLPHSLLVLLAVAACWLAAPSVQAQSRELNVPATYRQVIEDAIRQYSDRHYLEARMLFERAHQLWPNARTLRGLGKVAFELKRYRDARHYLEAARHSNTQPLDQAMREDAQRLEDKARSYLAEVTVELTPREAELFVDGALETPRAGQQLLLDPGDHAIEALAPGYTSERRAYALRAAEHATWTIQLQSVRVLTLEATHRAPPPSAAAPAPVQAAAKEPPATPVLKLAAGDVRRDSGATTAAPAWLLPTGLGLSFAGVAAAGVGGGFFAGYLDAGDKFRLAMPNSERSYEARWLAARNRSLLMTTIGSGVLTLGAVALAELIPSAERRWVSPSAFVLGTGLLVAGLVMHGNNSCQPAPGSSFRACSSAIEHGDTGSMLAILSAPLITVGIVHAVEWLVSL